MKLSELLMRSAARSKDPLEGVMVEKLAQEAVKLEIALENAARDGVQAGLEKAIKVVETYRVSVGNSGAGELVAEWTMDNLKEIRDELRDMVTSLYINQENE